MGMMVLIWVFVHALIVELTYDDVIISIWLTFSITAMARVTMTHAAVSSRPSAHSPLDNVSTKYNPIRLLKGAPPGQDKVNYYTSELHIARMAREKQKDKNRHHLFNVEAFGDFDYHHNFYQGAANREMKFWEPEMLRNYTKKI